MQGKERYVVTAEWEDNEGPGLEEVGRYAHKADALMAAITWADGEFINYSRNWDDWARVDVYTAELYEEVERGGVDTEGDVLHMDTSDFYGEV